MDKDYHIWKSDKPSKKLCVVHHGRKIHFGATGYSDFTKHKDIERRDRYDARHRKTEHWNDSTTAGFWAKWILWNKPTIIGSARDTAKRFGIKIRVHLKK